MSEHYEGSEPGEGDVLEEGEQHRAGGDRSDAEGATDTQPATTEIETPATDPEVKDSGPPAEGIADPEGTSGGEAGLNPWAPQSYDAGDEGPTTSTEGD